jgi:hypothetical protein
MTSPSHSSKFAISRSPTRPSNFARNSAQVRLARLCPTVVTKSSITARRRDIGDAGSATTARAPTSTRNRYYRRRCDIDAKSLLQSPPRHRRDIAITGAAATSTPNLALVGSAAIALATTSLSSQKKNLYLVAFNLHFGRTRCPQWFVAQSDRPPGFPPLTPMPTKWTPNPNGRPNPTDSEFVLVGLLSVFLDV